MASGEVALASGEVASAEVASEEVASAEEASVEVASEEVASPIQLHKTTLVNFLLDITTRPHTIYYIVIFLVVVYPNECLKARVDGQVIVRRYEKTKEEFDSVDF